MSKAAFIYRVSQGRRAGCSALPPAPLQLFDQLPCWWSWVWSRARSLPGGPTSPPWWGCWLGLWWRLHQLLLLTVLWPYSNTPQRTTMEKAHGACQLS